jgi:hypothetical protein
MINETREPSPDFLLYSEEEATACEKSTNGLIGRHSAVRKFLGLISCSSGGVRDRLTD